MFFVLEPRLHKPKYLSFFMPFLAILLTLAVAAIIFAILGAKPLETVRVLFVDPFFDPYNLPEVFVKAAPMILIAVGLSIGFRAGIWNIGAEGQFIMGAVGASAVAMALYPGGGGVAIPLMVLAGMALGAIYALIVALLRVKFQASEILVSLMLVYVAEQIIELVVRGPLQDPEGLGFPKSRSFQDDALLPILFDGTRVHLGVVIAILIAIAAHFVMQRHRFGLDVRVAGQAPRAARFSGVNDGKIIFATLAIGGAFAGLAGAFEVAGPAGVLDGNIAQGYGFTAIIVAFLGRLNPIAAIFAALLVAASSVGGSHFSFRLPPDTVLMVQGLMLFFLLAVELFENYKLKWRG